MRSAELAGLAGVSVRTLRHYHQTGLLEEPPRHRNGYRDYTVHDLVRLLRIRRLASLGIPLERMPPLLDDVDADAGSALEELDAELAAQVDRLNAQRAVIAHLRAHGAAPDLPPELAPFLAVFSTAPLPSSMVQHDRDQSVLLAHLAGDEGLRSLAAFYERLSEPDIAPRATEIARRYAELGSESADAEVTETAEALVAMLRPLIDELSPGEDGIVWSGPLHLLTEYTDDALNDQQRRCLHLAERMLEERDGAAGG
ncbi:MerR family transcriptional regulator [Microbacterium sp.]|uniref:MerR family transcriptional regulator n=1 Tax=Microbacterium sp. TaxID=51671 RepID=UPI0039E42058